MNQMKAENTYNYIHVMHARRGVILIILEGQRQEDVLREHRRVHVLEQTQPVLRRRDGVDERAAARMFYLSRMFDSRILLKRRFFV
jgi:hypothetical protein